MITEKQVDRKMRNVLNCTYEIWNNTVLGNRIQNPIIRNCFQKIFEELFYGNPAIILMGDFNLAFAHISGHINSNNFIDFHLEYPQKNKQNILLTNFEHFKFDSKEFRRLGKPKYSRRKYRFTYFISDYYNISNERTYQLIEKGQIQLL